ncbi:MAG TPA: hypothetical protein PKA13_21495 [Geminicoccaceae bacterium]|nr:hypothetical protein [Geminicoccus sp.]HMU52369.1 hypothetical protein [Geminicoccaceae bacterium]
MLTRLAVRITRLEAASVVPIRAISDADLDARITELLTKAGGAELAAAVLVDADIRAELAASLDAAIAAEGVRHA